MVVISILKYTEGSKLKKLNFPDPFGYGSEYRPVFPPRHRALKAIMDNIPDSVKKIYIFGSSLRLDSAMDSDLDIFIVGNVTNMQLRKMLMAVPDGETVDFLVETEEEFLNNLSEGSESLYSKVYESGYKIYEKQ